MPPSTPQEQIRASIALTVSPMVGERLLQAIKANPGYKLGDLRNDDERAILIEAAMAFLLNQNIRLEVTERLNQLRAFEHAEAEAEQEDVMRQARSDVARFGTVRPGFCYCCREKVITNKVTLLITDNLSADAHGLCCSKDEARFERIEDFLYRVKESF